MSEELDLTVIEPRKLAPPGMTTLSAKMRQEKGDYGDNRRKQQVSATGSILAASKKLTARKKANRQNAEARDTWKTTAGKRGGKSAKKRLNTESGQKPNETKDVRRLKGKGRYRKFLEKLVTKKNPRSSEKRALSFDPQKGRKT